MKRAVVAAAFWVCASAFALLLFAFAGTSAAAAASAPHAPGGIVAALQVTPTDTVVVAATPADQPTVAPLPTDTVTVAPGEGDTPTVAVAGDETATPAPGADTPSGALPGDQATSGPAPVLSVIPNAVDTVIPGGDNSGSTDNNSGDNGGTDNPVPPDQTATAASGPPWLLIIGIVVIILLAAVAIWAYMRRADSAPRPAAKPVATRATVVTPAASDAAVAPIAGQVRCPNCGTMNPADRRFCDECGQDLRDVAAAASATAVAAAAPPTAAVIDESELPYLETLSRPSEQLEYVLTRDTVNIGRAADNDIVIDEQFLGWPTVSQHHARLRRENGSFVLEDLNSENGTTVNGARTGANVLEDGMTLGIGKVDFIYRVP